MARKLTDQQRMFLAVLFNEAGGDYVTAKKLAGYSETTATSLIVESLKDEILEATKDYLVQNAPKAAMSFVSVMNDPTELGVKDKLNAAKEVLDRIGIIKTERVEVESKSGIVLMPPKKRHMEDEEEDDRKN